MNKNDFKIHQDAKCIGVGSDAWLWQHEDMVIKQFDLNTFRIGGDRLSNLTVNEASQKIYTEFNLVQHIHETIQDQKILSHVVKMRKIKYSPTTKMPIAIEMEKLNAIDIPSMLDVLSVPNGILSLSTQLIDTMYQIHSKCCISHNDIKPFNCILTVLSDGTLQLVIVDWGNASMINQSVKSLGTLAYRAPEILQTVVETQDMSLEKIDVWAIGCTMLDWFIAGKHIECKMDRFENVSNAQDVWKWWKLHYYGQDGIQQKLQNIVNSSYEHSARKKVAELILKFLVQDPEKRSSLNVL